MTFTFFLIELIVGHISHSITLTADSFHMLSDALALCIGLFAAIISKRTSTKNTYGWVRAEVLGPFINSVFLISLCLGIVIEAIERLVQPERLKDIDLLLWVGSLGLFINLVGLVIFGHGHSHSIDKTAIMDDSDDEEDISEIVHNIQDGEVALDKAETSVDTEQNVFVKQKKADDAKETRKRKKKCCSILSSEANMNMRAVFLHVLADALGSVIVIISALLNKYQEELKLPETLINLIDPVLCLCLVTLILSTALPLLKESGLILLQTVPKEIEVAKLRRDLVNKIPGLLNVHELHIWRLSGSKIIATAHVTFRTATEYMMVAAKIKTFFHKKGIHSTTIQPEFIDQLEAANGDVTEDCLIECMSHCIADTCCGPQIARNKSIASQLKEPV